MSEWDYIIVGGGSAGCVIANRLSADPAVRVLLLEAGGSGRLPLITAPGGVIYLEGNPRFDWVYDMAPDPTCDDRTEVLNAGKVLGGGSAINGMMYIRGHRNDFDEWARMGNKGWSYEDVLPYFRKIEKTSIGDDIHHGRDGLLGVEYATPMLQFSELFIEAAVNVGIRHNPDINGAEQEGISRTPCSTWRGIRQSTAITYLAAARGRPNLKIVTRALSHRVLIEQGRAVGVEYQHKGRRHRIRARSEVILCAGAVRSPQLLLLSGIGPREQLGRFGIPLVHDLPGVGRNHMEHPAAYVIYEVGARTWNREITLLNQARHGLSWALLRKGPAASGMSQAVAFAHSRPGLSQPDLQLSLLPAGFEIAADSSLNIPTNRDLVLVVVNALQPEGRGALELASDDPTAAPDIRPQMLAGTTTMACMRSGIELVRSIFASAPVASLVKREVSPGADVASTQALDSFLRSNVRDTVHPCGTCRMGPGRDAVVDARLRVHGVSGLRVADASIMPRITSGNTNAATIMIGEKASDMILEDRAH